MKLLNIGCGSVYDSTWTNIDLVSSSPYVYNVDITKGLPYDDGAFDACYSSHMIEHLARHEASLLISECYRILKSSGIIRIVVPDLEAIARHYLSIIDNIQNAEKELEIHYDWIVMELIDQCTRTSKGGEISSFLKKPAVKHNTFIHSRIGMQADKYWKDHPTDRMSTLHKIKKKNAEWFFNTFRMIVARLLVVRLFLGKKGLEALAEGWFRRSSGEIHRWMYDRYSVKRILVERGFEDVDVTTVFHSRIPSFSTYQLDTIDNQIRKPDSLYVEAVKP
jgi:SAM-dependent methyltransferase